MALLALLPSAAYAQGDGDGTTSEEWTLDNGLHVVVRNVPGATSVAIIVAYDIGWLENPAGSEHFTLLMANAAFLAEAGDVPARTRAELDALRPIGWNVQVARTRTELAEMASKDRFPGVLHDAALRMRSVNITKEIVDEAREAVVAELGERYVDHLGARLHAEIGVRAGGGSEATLNRWITGKGIANITARDVAERAAQVYVPANAVLSLAGDFTGVNLHAFTQREFGDIPAGVKLVRTAAGKATPSQTDTVLPQAPRALGGVGIMAPALADTSHPSFFLTMLMLGTHANIQWGRPNSPLSSRFQYSILDDPSVARFYPPVKSNTWTASNLSIQLSALAEHFNSLNVDYESVQRVQMSVEWLLGGPLPESLQERVKSDPAVLYRVASSAGARRLLGDRAFWTRYRRQFDPTVGASYARWHDYICASENHSAVIYLPPK
jgi:hypothetical protein